MQNSHFWYSLLLQSNFLEEKQLIVALQCHDLPEHRGPISLDLLSFFSPGHETMMFTCYLSHFYSL